MALIPKPETTIRWAEGGNQLEPASEVQELGFVVEKPPYEVVNWLHNKHDTSIAYLFQEGSPEWDIETEYSNTSYVKYDGIIYKSKLQNIGKQPDINPDNWEVAFANYQDYADLYQDLQDTKNIAGHADNLVYKDAPIMTNRVDATSYKANVGKSLTPTDNVGYVFDGKETDGIFHDGNRVVAQKGGAVIVSFDKVNSITERTDTVVTMSVLQQLIDSIKEPFAPVGSIVAMATRVVPEGYLECNGNTVSRATYAKLFSVIGTTFGAGDSVNTFNLPDLRGEFIRGLDSGRGVDASRQLGSRQGDAMRNITGEFQSTDDNITANVLKGVFYYTGRAAGTGSGGSGVEPVVGFDASRQVPTANENRPRNIALMYIIKT